MPFRHRDARGYLTGWFLVTVLVAASVGVAVTAQAVPGVAGPPRIDRWPCRVVAAETLREAFERGWERSRTIRSQCEELAAARAVVALEWASTNSMFDARSVMAVRAGVVAATVRIPAVGETIALLAHELQHVVERTRGLDFEAESQRPHSGVWKTAGGYETQGAVDVTRQVSNELREATQRSGRRSLRARPRHEQRDEQQRQRAAGVVLKFHRGTTAGVCEPFMIASMRRTTSELAAATFVVSRGSRSRS